MHYFPQPVFANILSFLHKPYDYERGQVIAELNRRCAIFGADFQFLELVPQLMLPTECRWKRLQSKYRCYTQRWALDTERCTCVYCRNDLWGIY